MQKVQITQELTELMITDLKDDIKNISVSVANYKVLHVPEHLEKELVKGLKEKLETKKNLVEALQAAYLLI